jgi:predicted O-linked N-acetylglucosamine transferase (SPINDLY family)
MDYRLTDSRADPPGEGDAFHTEKVVRLDPVFVSFEPPADAPDCADMPVRKNGFVTFGCFNSLAKITDGVIGAWAEILRRVPDARLVLKARGLGDPAGRDRVLSAFRREGMDEQRIECLGHIVALQGHLGAYREIDIALDTFPYNGTTTTCEALWMGVPVVTCAGDRHASRVGSSLLSAVGIPECITHSRDEYISLAAALATDPKRPHALRSGLRSRMRASPLMDVAGFARMLEARYRDMLSG